MKANNYKERVLESRLYDVLHILERIIEDFREQEFFSEIENPIQNKLAMIKRRCDFISWRIEVSMK